MTAQSSFIPAADFAEILSQAVVAFQTHGTEGESSSSGRPEPITVVQALLYAEKTAKQQRQNYLVESLFGNWQLCFTTAGKVTLRQGQPIGKRGFYAPRFAPAQISLQPFGPSTATEPKLEISNQIQCGPILFRVTGPARYLGRNLLTFDFTNMQIKVLGKTIYQGTFPGRTAPATDFSTQSITQLPFFSFFWVTDDFIAARGRGGGLAIWARSPD